MRDWVVMLDGRAIGWISAGAVLNSPIAPGRHDLAISAGTGTTARLQLIIAGKTTARVECRPRSLLSGSLLRKRKPKIELARTD